MWQGPRARGSLPPTPGGATHAKLQPAASRSRRFAVTKARRARRQHARLAEHAAPGCGPPERSSRCRPMLPPFTARTRLTFPPRRRAPCGSGVARGGEAGAGRGARHVARATLDEPELRTLVVKLREEVRGRAGGGVPMPRMGRGVEECVWLRRCPDGGATRCRRHLQAPAPARARPRRPRRPRSGPSWRPALQRSMRSTAATPRRCRATAAGQSRSGAAARRRRSRPNLRSGVWRCGARQWLAHPPLLAHVTRFTSLVLAGYFQGRPVHAKACNPRGVVSRAQPPASAAAHTPTPPPPLPGWPTPSG
jgi:hypothetical protein